MGHYASEMGGSGEMDLLLRQLDLKEALRGISQAAF